jgi:1,2-phenylacetyl-CoA epoxidase PaaB subunit
VSHDRARSARGNDEALVTLLRAADDAASVAHDFIYGRNDVTQRQAGDAIWAVHNALRPLFEADPEPSERLSFAEAVHEMRAKLVALQNAPHEEHAGAACPICLLTNRMLRHLVEQSDA